MARYFLDTNICIYALHRKMPAVLDRLLAANQQSLVVSTLVYAELAAGAQKSQRPASNQALLQAFLAEMTVEPWGANAIWHYARQLTRLQAAGKVIGTIDLLLGCQALAEDATLVTNNTREFERIDGLKLENWAA